MPLSYELSHTNDYLLLTAKGRYDCEEDILSYTRSFVGALVEQAPQTVIIDHRAVTGQIKDLNATLIAAEFSRFIKELTTMKIAVVSTPERLMAVKFLETIAQNQGIMAMGFDSFEDAEAWLKR